MKDVVSMGVVGAVLREAIILVKETITTVVEMFRTRLRSILEQLNSLNSQFDKMRGYKYKYDYPMDIPYEELRPIYDMLRACQRLVKKCKKISRWQIYDKHQCLKQLEEMENHIVIYCGDNLLAIIGIDVEEANTALSEMKGQVRVRMNRVRLWEDVPIKNIKDELLELDPVKVVESAAGGGGYGNRDGSPHVDPVPLKNPSEKSALVSTLCHYYEQVKGEYEYDVFLSFRGDDTRESFTSTLFNYLSEVRKIKTFMDVNFKKGSKLEELLKMVEKSRMSIVVFSENFAESEWCLKELTKIFEERDRRGHEVVPVFFKVNPSELRHQDNGKTKVHMDKHYNTYGKDSDNFKRWSHAIKELGNSSGYTHWSGRGKLEIDLAKEIAQDIGTRLHGRGYLSKPTRVISILFLVFLIYFYFLLAKLVIIPW